MRDLISIILVNPKRSENVGACARAMNCMGFEDLVLVEPRCQIDRFAFKCATGSAHILECARTFSTLEEALKGYGLSIGTTRREGKRRYNFITPGEMVQTIIPRSYPARTAIIFGSEDYGLSRHNLRMCQYLVTIPTGERFGSLNLSHAVMIICYEIHRALFDLTLISNDEDAGSVDLNKLCLLIDDTFQAIRFPTRRSIDQESGRFKEIFTRTHLKQWEVDFILGFLRHLRFMGKKLWDE